MGQKRWMVFYFVISVNPAALTAATSFVWSFEFTAFSTMFFDEYMIEPQTITFFFANEVAPNANAIKEINKNF